MRFQDAFLEDLSCKGMRWRGYSPYPIHPKHLFDETRSEENGKYLRSGISFLDLGSGSGTECIAAAAAGAVRVIGLEYNEASLTLARSRVPDSLSGIEFIKHDLEIVPFLLEDASFDLVHFTNVLEHLHNRSGVLSEVKRLLKPDGFSVISIPNTGTKWKKMLRSVGLDSRDDRDHKIEYTPDSLEKELSAAGLERFTELAPIIPSLPINGIVAFSAIFSRRIYRRLQQWKRDWVSKHPEESIGWVFQVRP